MPQPFHVGDRVCFRSYNPLVRRAILGTVQQVYLSAPGCYDVILDETGEICLVRERDLTLMASASELAPLVVAQTREVGGSRQRESDRSQLE